MYLKINGISLESPRFIIKIWVGEIQAFGSVFDEQSRREVDEILSKIKVGALVDFDCLDAENRKESGTAKVGAVGRKETPVGERVKYEYNVIIHPA